jgi:hypothetical protein
MGALTRLMHIGLEDFLLALRFPDFFTQQVGGFINIILRGLLCLKNNDYIHNAALQSPQYYTL